MVCREDCARKSRHLVLYLTDSKSRSAISSSWVLKAAELCPASLPYRRRADASVEQSRRGQVASPSFASLRAVCQRFRLVEMVPCLQ